MASTGDQWNASEVLNVKPHSVNFTCVGLAVTQGRRCRNIIAKENRSAASRFLQDMGQQDIQSVNFDRQLESLAHRVLCRRWHANDEGQIMSKVDQWKTDIVKFRAAESARQTRMTRVEIATGIEEGTGVAVAGPNLVDTLESLRRELATLNERYANALQLATPAPVATLGASQTVPRTETSPSASLTRQGAQVQEPRNVSRDPSTDTVASDLVRPDIRQRTREEEDTEEEEKEETDDDLLNPNGRASTSQSESVEADLVPISSQDETGFEFTSAHSNVEPVESGDLSISMIETSTTLNGGQTRRHIDGECSICSDSLASGRNLSWCRAQCGQNFHSDCIAVWHDTQEDSHRTPSCPYCRAEWID